MKLLVTILSLVTISLTVSAATLDLKSGETAVITANVETAVKCEGKPAPVKIIEYSFCECKYMNLNGRDTAQAVFTMKYSDSLPNTTVLKEFYDSYEYRKQCPAFLETVQQCKKRS